MTDKVLTLTESELADKIKQGILEAKLEILIGDFTAYKKDEGESLIEIKRDISHIYELIRSFQTEFPDRVTSCRDDLEEDMEKTYMTKADGALLEQHLANSIRSIRIWIVATVGGFTSAGVLLAWSLQLLGVK